MDALKLIEVAALAFPAGMLMGVIGGGGGGFYVIILTFVFNLPIKQAIGTALATSTVTALSGVIGHWRHGNLEKESTVYLGVTGVLGAVGGAILVQYLSSTLLKYMVVVFFAVIGLLGLIRTNRWQSGSKLTRKNKVTLLIPAGLISGIVSGAFGLSGSTPLSSYLISFTYLSPPVAVGTTLTAVLATSLAGAVVHYQQQAIDFKLVLVMSAGSVIGAYLGAKLTAVINKKVLAIVLAILALAFAVYLALH